MKARLCLPGLSTNFEGNAFVATSLQRCVVLCSLCLVRYPSVPAAIVALHLSIAMLHRCGWLYLQIHHARRDIACALTAPYLGRQRVPSLSCSHTIAPTGNLSARHRCLASNLHGRVSGHFKVFVAVGETKLHELHQSHPLMNRNASAWAPDQAELQRVRRASHQSLVRWEMNLFVCVAHCPTRCQASLQQPVICQAIVARGLLHAHASTWANGQKYFTLPVKSDLLSRTSESRQSQIRTSQQKHETRSIFT